MIYSRIPKTANPIAIGRLAFKRAGKSVFPADLSVLVLESPDGFDSAAIEIIACGYGKTLRDSLLSLYDDIANIVSLETEEQLEARFRESPKFMRQYFQAFTKLDLDVRKETWLKMLKDKSATRVLKYIHLPVFRPPEYASEDELSRSLTLDSSRSRILETVG